MYNCNNLTLNEYYLIIIKFNLILKKYKKYICKETLFLYWNINFQIDTVKISNIFQSLFKELLFTEPKSRHIFDFDPDFFYYLHNLDCKITLTNNDIINKLNQINDNIVLIDFYNENDILLNEIPILLNFDKDNNEFSWKIFYKTTEETEYENFWTEISYLKIIEKSTIDSEEIVSETQVFFKDNFNIESKSSSFNDTRLSFGKLNQNINIIYFPKIKYKSNLFKLKTTYIFKPIEIGYCEFCHNDNLSKLYNIIATYNENYKLVQTKVINFINSYNSLLC